MYWLLGLVIELYFLIKWVGEDNTFDVLCAKKIRSINKDILEVDEGDKVEGEFSGSFFPAGVLTRGKLYV